MQRRTFLAMSTAAAAVTATTPTISVKTLTVAAFLKAPIHEPAIKTEHAVYDPIFLASGNWGGQLLCSALYDALYVREPNGRIKPALAVETQVSTDRKRWKIKLGLPAYNGRRQPSPNAHTVAQRLRDVFSTKDKIQKSKNLAGRVRSTIATYGNWIKSIETAGSDTIVFVGHVPIPYLRHILAEPALRIALSPPTETFAMPGDGPMALVYLPAAYHPQTNDKELRGTFFELVPRNGPLRRRTHRRIELLALPDAHRRTTALRGKHAQLAINIRRAPTPPTSKVFTHLNGRGIGMHVAPQLNRPNIAATTHALRQWLIHTKTMDAESPYGALNTANLPTRFLGCARATTLTQHNRTRAIFELIESTRPVRCVAPKRFQKIAEAVVQSLQRAGLASKHAQTNEEAELTLKPISDNADPRIALTDLLPFPGILEQPAIPYPADISNAITTMLTARTRKAATAQACIVAQWCETQYPWAMLGWIREATATSANLDTGETPGLDPTNLDNVIDNWTLT